MSEKTKEWETPKLIILARGTPAENVLTHCKFIGAGEGGGPDTTAQNGCNGDSVDPDDPEPNNCGVCQARKKGS